MSMSPIIRYDLLQSLILVILSQMSSTDTHGVNHVNYALAGYAVIVLRLGMLKFTS